MVLINHSVALFILLFIVLVASAGTVFYYYGIIAVNAEPEISVEKVMIDEAFLQNVVEDIAARKQYKLPDKEYRNPF